MLVSLRSCIKQIVEVFGCEMTQHFNFGDADQFCRGFSDRCVVEWLTWLEEEDLFADPVFR